MTDINKFENDAFIEYYTKISC